jgi:hypothetical protein
MCVVYISANFCDFKQIHFSVISCLIEYDKKSTDSRLSKPGISKKFLSHRSLDFPRSSKLLVFTSTRPNEFVKKFWKKSNQGNFISFFSLRKLLPVVEVSSVASFSHCRQSPSSVLTRLTASRNGRITSVLVRYISTKNMLVILVNRFTKVFLKGMTVPFIYPVSNEIAKILCDKSP